VWFAGNTTPQIFTSTDLHNPTSIFVTTAGDMYISDSNNQQVKKWTLNSQVSAESLPVSGRCFGLFVDINNTLYCSVHDQHLVEKVILNDNPKTLTTVAGKRSCRGSTLDLLSSPHGIFVHIDFSLYVADWGNDRIQHFQFGQTYGTTVASNVGAGNIGLKRPSGIVIDEDGYLFIVDHEHHRTVRSGSNGFQCLVGCSKKDGSGSDQLHFPLTLAFNSDGNMFVTDRNNGRIQKFILASNSCSKYHNILL
jgi:DNA-binding beta-propeller fold protein YncE